MRIRFWDSLALFKLHLTITDLRISGMSSKQPSRDEALEAMDFIVNILKEHEKDLDRLINELGKVTEQMGEAGEINEKVNNIEQKIDSLQQTIDSLFKRASTQQEVPLPPPTAKAAISEPRAASIGTELPVMMQCKQWEDFIALASQAQTLSFSFTENDRLFKVDALKNNQIITYTGEKPRLSALVKAWLSKQLDIPEKKILEGELALH